MKKDQVLFLLIIVCQLFNFSCSKRINPQVSRQNIPEKVENNYLEKIVIQDSEPEMNSLIKLISEPQFHAIVSHGEDIKLQGFLKRGAYKKLDTHKTSSDEIILTARKYLGVPHCSGGSSAKCVDCSGLVMLVFAKQGISLPHNSEEQARFGQIIALKDYLVKGDLVFFIKTYKTARFITHTGIYVGNNEFIHSPSGHGVTVTSLDDPYWKEKFIFGTRVIR